MCRLTKLSVTMWYTFFGIFDDTSLWILPKTHDPSLCDTPDDIIIASILLKMNNGFSVNVGKRYAPNCANGNHPLVRHVFFNKTQRKSNNNCFPFRTEASFFRTSACKLIFGLAHRTILVGIWNLCGRTKRHVGLKTCRNYGVSEWRRVPMQIESENCITFFFSFWGGTLPSDRPLFSSMEKKLIVVLAKALEQETLE